MSSASFGTVNATGLNVAGVLQANQIVTTTPVQVSNIVSTGTVTANNISAAGTLGVTGNTTLSNVLASGLTNLANVKVTGSLLSASYVRDAVTGLVPYGTPTADARSVYELALSVGGGTAGDQLYGIADYEKTTSYKIFSNVTTRSVILSDRLPKDSKSYIVHYPTSNVYQPTYTQITDASNAVAYSNLMAPYAVATGSDSVSFTTHYNSSVPYGQTLPISPDTFSAAPGKFYRYMVDKGYEVTPPDYNTYFKNSFICNNPTGGALLHLEFGYDNATDTVPSNVYLGFIKGSGRYSQPSLSLLRTQTQTLNGGFLFTPKSYATDSNLYINPVVVPVTTDALQFQSSYGAANTKIALWDRVQNQIHIYFKGSSNTVSTGTTTASFNTTTVSSGISWTETHEMGEFRGSFAVLRKRDKITTLERPFSISNTSDTDAFLMQVSNVVTFSSNVYRNGSRVTSTSEAYYSGTTTRAITDASNKFTGLTLAKTGFGSTSFDASIYYYPSFNASEQEVSAFSVSGADPHVSIPLYGIAPTSFYAWNASDSTPMFPKIKYANLFTDTPEQLIANLTSSDFSYTSNGLIVSDLLFLHEYIHCVNDMNYYAVTPMESSATAAEIDYGRKYQGASDEFFMWNFRCSAYLSTLFPSFYKGWMPLFKGVSQVSNSLHGSAPGFNFQEANAKYGGAYPMYEIMQRYDTNNQLIKRTDYLIKSRARDIMAAAGYPQTRNLIESSTKLFQLCYNQAIVELTTAQGSPKTFSNVLVDEIIAMSLMRKNTSIPAKYRTTFPYALYNRHAPWFMSELALKLAPIPGFGQRAYIAIQSDNEENRPATRGLGTSTASSMTLMITDDTLFPTWPKTGSTFTSGGALQKNNLGTWSYSNPSDFSTFTTFTYTSNSYITTPITTQVEDLCSIGYVIPIYSNVAENVYGTADYISNVHVTVSRGDWVIKVVQYIPDLTGATQGVFTESTAVEINVPGVYSNVTDSWSDGTPQEVDIDFTSFTQACKGATYDFGPAWYFPRLFCVNRSNIDYANVPGSGEARNIWSSKCLYTGKITLQATTLTGA